MDKIGVITSFIHSIVVFNIPLLYGTVGEIVVEKSGSLNLGVEGTMAVGAIFGYICGCFANSLGVGILTAFLMGALCGLLFAVLTVSLQANQNITGLTLTTFGLGIYFFVGNSLKASGWPVMSNYANIKEGFTDISIPFLSDIPVIGKGLFSHNILVYLGIIIAVVVWAYLKHTKYGLRLRAVGENPAAADSVGINVHKMRWSGVTISGVLGGIGGFFYAVGVMDGNCNGHTGVAGFGFLALAVMIFGQWQPIKIAGAALLFAFLRTVAYSVPLIPFLSSLEINSGFYKMFPYIVTMIVLAFTSKNSRAPKAEGVPYDKGAR